jgi:hypothetical protein
MFDGSLVEAGVAGLTGKGILPLYNAAGDSSAVRHRPKTSRMSYRTAVRRVMVLL